MQISEVLRSSWYGGKSLPHTFRIPVREPSTCSGPRNVVRLPISETSCVAGAAPLTERKSGPAPKSSCSRPSCYRFVNFMDVMMAASLFLRHNFIPGVYSSACHQGTATRAGASHTEITTCVPSLELGAPDQTGLPSLRPPHTCSHLALLLGLGPRATQDARAERTRRAEAPGLLLPLPPGRFWSLSPSRPSCRRLLSG